MRENGWKVAVFFLGTAIFVFAPIPLCPMRVYLHVPCPGCGATRATLMALRGDLAASLQMHPLAIPAVLLVVPTLLAIARSILEGNPGKPLPLVMRRAWTLLVAALFAIWVLRFFGMFGGPAPI